MSTLQSTSEKLNYNWFSTQADKFEESRFFWMSLGITVQSCLGSLACMFILQNNAGDVQLISGAAITMASNAMFISQAPAKWCVGTFYLSIVVNLLLLAINIL